MSDTVDRILKEPKNRTKEPKLVGCYLDLEVAIALDKVAKMGGRGAKSQIVNETIKKMLQEKGLL